MTIKNDILPNQRFGYLTTIIFIPDNKPIWKCKCDCGNICYFTPYQLRNGRAKSCGCKKYIGLNKTKEKRIIDNPYYNKWQYHKRKGNNPEFDNIDDFILWYEEQQLENSGNKITKRLRMQWRNCISKDQNGDFKDLESYSKWAYEQGYVEDIHRLHKKNKNKPHSKKNTEFGFYYNKKFLSINKCRKLNFCYDRNRKLFYGYIKYKGKTYNTKKYQDFDSMYQEHKTIYYSLWKVEFQIF